MRGIPLRTTPVAMLAAGVAALIAWALRAHAESLPDGRLPVHSLLLSDSPAHGHAVGAGAFEPPPAVTGDALANYAGLAMVALHVMLIGVAVAVWGVRRWARPAVGLLARTSFAASVALAAALITMLMAVALLDAAISFPAALTAAVTVLQYSFVFVIVSSAVVGLP